MGGAGPGLRVKQLWLPWDHPLLLIVCPAPAQGGVGMSVVRRFHTPNSSVTMLLCPQTDCSHTGFPCALHPAHTGKRAHHICRSRTTCLRLRLLVCALMPLTLGHWKRGQRARSAGIWQQGMAAGPSPSTGLCPQQPRWPLHSRDEAQTEIHTAASVCPGHCDTSLPRTHTLSSLS